MEISLKKSWGNLFFKYIIFFKKNLILFIYFLIEGWLLYRISFSAKYQHESEIGIHVSPPFWTSLLISPVQVVTEPLFEFPETNSKFWGNLLTNEMIIQIKIRITLTHILYFSMGREVGGGFRIGKTYTPVADSCWCMTKPIQYCKVK